jgi:transcriptional regulator with XRE-family HTH domain
MESRIREVRRAKKLTLADIAARCQPATTAQTIGRLETGMRRLTLPWLNRLAAAMDVEPAELMVTLARADIPVTAVLDAGGADAPTRPMSLVPPDPSGTLLGVLVEVSQGDYRAGDQLWCAKVEPEGYGQLLNRDVLAPLPVGRFAFGRLVSVVGGHIRLLPPSHGARLIEVAGPAWLAPVQTLIRTFN